MRHTGFLAAEGLLVLLLVVYAVDYFSLRYRLPGGRSQFAQVSVDTVWAIRQKNGKTEYQLAQTELVPCVHALFPHFGSNPCWYAKRHRERRIDI